MKKVYGKGINDLIGCVSTKDKSYIVWSSMLERCYSDRFHAKNPTYIGCIVCDEWLYFSNFKEWFDKNYRWDLDEKGLKLSLDKDLFSINGIKEYSPLTCIFLPKEVNSFISNIHNFYKDTSGIIYEHGFYRIRIKRKNSRKREGKFKDLEDAKKFAYSFRNIILEEVKDTLRKSNYNESVISKLQDFVDNHIEKNKQQKNIKYIKESI